MKRWLDKIKHSIGAEAFGKKEMADVGDVDQDLVWTKCMRFMMVHSLKEIDDLAKCLEKILINLISAPGEQRFASLPFLNTHLQKHLFCYNGGVEILQGLGFRWCIDVAPDGGQVKFLRLPVAYFQNPAPFLEAFRACLRWLEHACRSCNALYAAKVEAWLEDVDCMPLPELVAEVVVQLELPTGPARGGFFATETIEHVYQLARSFFVPEMRHRVRIHVPDGVDPLEPSGETLFDLKLFPRVRLLVSSRDAMEHAATMEEVRQRVLEQQTIERVKIVQSKSTRLEEQRQAEIFKQKTLRAFKADRLRPRGHTDEEEEEDEKKRREAKIHGLWELTDDRQTNKKDRGPGKDPRERR